MKKLLVTGASGFLGWHLCQLAQSQWQLYGTYHTRSVEMAGVTMLPLDLTDSVALRQLMQQVQPDAVIHTAALSSPNACQSEPDLSYRVNVAASWEMAELCAAAGIPCVFTSSEQVFDGLNPPYRETDPACPINLYGEHKLAAEVGMLERCPDVVICRMPLMFGAAPTADSFIQPWIKALRTGRSIDLFTDEIRNPVSGMDAAQGIFLALANVKGIIHLGGKERLSRYQIGQVLAEVLQLPTEHLNPCQQADVKMAAPRPPDVSLNSELAFGLGYQPKGVKEALEGLQADL
jgi:dTDP-4-dehydrorhamnose reductase